MSPLVSTEAVHIKLGAFQELECQNKHISHLLLTPHFPRLLSKK